MTVFNRKFVPELLIILTGALLYIPFLGGVHLFDWDEVNFAESAREMIVTGDYLTVNINFIPFWEKPPLFIWFQVISMKIFGINEFAARFPNAICGIVTLLYLYITGRKLIDRSFGFLWIMTYIGSILPFFYFKSGIIDPWFNLFIFSGLVSFILFLDTDKSAQRWLRLLLSAASLGLAVLTKGPTAILIFGLVVITYWILNKFRLKISAIEIISYILVLILVGGIWFLIQLIIGNWHVVLDFLTYQVRLFKNQDAGHGGFFLYHPIVLFIGVFPASVFALKGFRRGYYDDPFLKRFKLWLLILFLAVLILFSIVRTKIVHYSSLCYFPLTFFGAYTIHSIINKRAKNYNWLHILYAVLGILYGIAGGLLPFIMINKDRILQAGWIKDEFAAANLQASVHWSGYEALTSLPLIAGVIFVLFLLGRNKKLAYIFLFGSTLIWILLNILIITPKVEKISQNALIEFCKDRVGEDCYVETLGMKSYAHLFYTAKKKPLNENSYNREWLLTGKIDKPVYFILRNRSAAKYRAQYPELSLYNEKNGYVFLKREINQPD
jgi:4-amino-4-deoxy-L-arabinose transferase-like glycosyltransferase